MWRYWARHPSRLRRAAITGHPSMPWRTRPCKRSDEVAPHLICPGRHPSRTPGTNRAITGHSPQAHPPSASCAAAYPAQALQLLFGYLAKAQVQGRARAVHPALCQQPYPAGPAANPCPQPTTARSRHRSGLARL
uniref:Uncharacterized protein ORF14 n=1 Tax=Metapseudomonas resinovorans TaxID=53412 RepID=Q9AQM9_METRE|nr:hypothetical protein [Pseudomonas resinovorans]